MRPVRPIIDQANAAFLNLEVELDDQRRDHAIISRRIGRYTVIHCKTPDAAADLIGRRAVAAGLGNHLKLMWQLAGRMRYEGSRRKLDIAPGDLLITSMAEDYRLEMFGGHEALILIFDPADDPKWPELAADALTTPIARRAGIMAAAGGVRALLSVPEDRTGEFAAHTMIDLALLSTRQPDRDDDLADPHFWRERRYMVAEPQGLRQNSASNPTLYRGTSDAELLLHAQRLQLGAVAMDTRFIGYGNLSGDFRRRGDHCRAALRFRVVRAGGFRGHVQ